MCSAQGGCPCGRPLAPFIDPCCVGTVFMLSVSLLWNLKLKWVEPWLTHLLHFFSSVQVVFRLNHVKLLFYGLNISHVAIVQPAIGQWCARTQLPAVLGGSGFCRAELCAHHPEFVRNAVWISEPWAVLMPQIHKVVTTGILTWRNIE